MNTNDTYKIVDILHSGRQGIREEPYRDEKHNGLIGSVFKITRGFEQFKPVYFEFIETQSGHDWLRTSALIQLSLDYHNLYHLETVNTIYVIQKLVD